MVIKTWEIAAGITSTSFITLEMKGQVKFILHVLVNVADNLGIFYLVHAENLHTLHRLHNTAKIK